MWNKIEPDIVIYNIYHTFPLFPPPFASQKIRFPFFVLNIIPNTPIKNLPKYELTKEGN